jgi:DNA-binding beta-propeller fold protein YncE
VVVSQSLLPLLLAHILPARIRLRITHMGSGACGCAPGWLGRATIPGGTGPIVVNGRSGRLFAASAPAGSAGPMGAISVVDHKDGTILQTIDGLFPQDMTIDEGLNRVYATVSATPGPGHVAVIGATSGRLIRTVTVGRYPGQVVASARAGQAPVHLPPRSSPARAA